MESMAESLSFPKIEPKFKIKGEEEEEEAMVDEKVLLFMDSLDSYITLMDSLSSSLRQGWLELASARHSMGSSRISSVLLDQKVKSASTTVQVTESMDDGTPSVSEPHYTLSKWGSLGEECSSIETEVGTLRKDSYGSKLRHRGSSHPPESAEETQSAASLIAVDNYVQRERIKSLSVFGTLVSPKLRSAQVSFETALETVVEIANMRSLVLATFSQLQKEKELSLKS